MCTLMRQKLHKIELIQDLTKTNAPATFETDPRKIADVRELSVIFNAKNWKMRKILTA